MVKNITKIMTGLLILAAVFIGYIPQPKYLIELTCVSNTFGGLLLLTDGIISITKRKPCPNSFYLNITVSLLVVYFVCMGSLTGAYKFNFSGAFFFMHVIDPIAFLIYYILFVNEHDRKTKFVLTAPTLTMAYLLFDYMRYKFTGEFVYGFIKPEELTLAGTIIAAIVIYALLYLFSLFLFMLNRLVHKRSEKFQQL